jgi:hypothetical protein
MSKERTFSAEVVQIPEEWGYPDDGCFRYKMLGISVPGWIDNRIVPVIPENGGTPGYFCRFVKP